MSSTKGYGCPDCEWNSVMVPIWVGWWIPDVHLRLHNLVTKHGRPQPSE